MDIEDSLAFRKSRFEYLFVVGRGQCRSGRNRSFTEHVVIGVRIECIEVNVWADFFLADEIRHRDEGDAIFLGLGFGNVAIGINENVKHGYVRPFVWV